MKDICLVYASALNGLLYKLCRRWIIITHCYVITLINDDWTVGDRYRGRLVPRLVYVLYYKPSLVSGSPSSFFCFCKLLRCFFFPHAMEIILAALIMHTHSLFPEIQNSSLVPHEKNRMQMWEILFSSDKLHSSSSLPQPIANPPLTPNTAGLDEKCFPWKPA